jgi:hypothetical protein
MTFIIELDTYYIYNNFNAICFGIKYFLKFVFLFLFFIFGATENHSQNPKYFGLT